jgi:nucleoside-triphosphatase
VALKALVEGRPGTGKTTVALRVVELLRRAGVDPKGFVTEELREGGRRVGFAIEGLDGERATLAHVEFKAEVRVGKYGVDVESFERIALPALRSVTEKDLLVIDELGKMELASEPFVGAVTAAFEQSPAILATVHAFRHDLTDTLKARPDVEVIRLSPSNRDALPERLVERLTD